MWPLSLRGDGGEGLSVRATIKRVFFAASLISILICDALVGVDAISRSMTGSDSLDIVDQYP